MIKWFNQLIANDSLLSSSRFLNVTGGFVLNKTISIDVFNTFTVYYASVYTLGKTVGIAKGRVDDTN